MEKAQVQKYPLHRVQAMIFQDRQEVSDFVEANKDIILELRVQAVAPPIVVLFVWKD